MTIVFIIPNHADLYDMPPHGALHLALHCFPKDLSTTIMNKKDKQVYMLNDNVYLLIRNTIIPITLTWYICMYYVPYLNKILF